MEARRYRLNTSGKRKETENGNNTERNANSHTLLRTCNGNKTGTIFLNVPYIRLYVRYLECRCYAHVQCIMNTIIDSRCYAHVQCIMNTIIDSRCYAHVQCIMNTIIDSRCYAHVQCIMNTIIDVRVKKNTTIVKFVRHFLIRNHATLSWFASEFVREAPRYPWIAALYKTTHCGTAIKMRRFWWEKSSAHAVMFSSSAASRLLHSF